MSKINHQFKLAARPVGNVKRSDFDYASEALRDPAETKATPRLGMNEDLLASGL